MELEGSTTTWFITRCQVDWPSRDRNQLAKTAAALGWGAPFRCASTLLLPLPMAPASLMFSAG